MKGPSVNDLKTHVVKKKKKLRSKSLVAKKAAKKALLSQPATTEPQEGPQGQAGDQSLAAGLNPSEDSEVQVLGEVNGSNDQSRIGLGAQRSARLGLESRDRDRD